MSDPILTSIDEMVTQKPSVDNQAHFDRLWSILGDLKDKVFAQFALQLDPCCHDIRQYSGKDGSGGELAVYSGPQIDWLVHSWTGNPKATFTNMHLTVNLAASLDVPHFGLAFGTVPQLFWYMDYLPRKELVHNPEYALKYYSEANKQYLELQADPRFKPFVSRDLYTRVALTPTACCFGADISDEALDAVEEHAHRYLDRWLQYVAEAQPVPQSQQSALAERDLMIRKTICEKDPANIVAEKLFGKELSDYLVQSRWGGNSTLSRPIE